MQKAKFFPIILLLLPVFFDISCKKDKDTVDTKNPLIGKWLTKNAEVFEIDEFGNETLSKRIIAINLKNLEYLFLKTGKYKYGLHGNEDLYEEGKYSVSNFEDKMYLILSKFIDFYSPEGNTSREVKYKYEINFITPDSLHLIERDTTTVYTGELQFKVVRTFSRAKK